jgi:hypothetical protein
VADERLYAAKRGGRARVACVGSGMKTAGLPFTLG